MNDALKKKLREFERTRQPKRKTKVRPKGLIADPCNEWAKHHPDLTIGTLKPFAEYLAGCVYQAMLSTFSKGSQPFRIRASDQKCTRAAAYSKLGLGDPIPDEKDSTFFMGHVAEAWTKVVAGLAGVDLRNSNMKVTIPIPGHTCSVCGGENECSCGEVDCTLHAGKKKYIVDVKGTKESQWPHLNSNFAKDTWGYRKQLNVYSLDKRFKDYDGKILIYVDRTNWNRWKEFFIPPNTQEETEAWYNHVAAVSNATRKKMPRKPSWATSRRTYIYEGGRGGKKIDVEKLEHIRCIYCSKLQACWGKGFYAREGKTEAIRNV